jgi:hypothetical protein
VPESWRGVSEAGIGIGSSEIGEMVGVAVEFAAGNGGATFVMAGGEAFAG